MSMYEAQDVSLTTSTTRDVSLFQFFNQVYAWMFVGVGVTAVVGLACSKIPAIAVSLTNPYVAVAAALGAFALAMAAQGAAMRISAGVGLLMFMLYAAAIGVLTSYVFLVYNTETLLGAFLITSGVFGATSFVGGVIKKDLSLLGRVATMAILGLFAASLFNIFFASEPLSWFITYGVLVLFIVLVAWKTQDLKNLAYAYADQPELLNRAAVVGSIILYISFINLLLAILRILGSRR